MPEWFDISCAPRTTPTHQIMLYRPAGETGETECMISGYLSCDEKGTEVWLACNGHPLGHWSPHYRRWMGGPTHWRPRAERPE